MDGGFAVASVVPLGPMLDAPPGLSAASGGSQESAVRALHILQPDTHIGRYTYDACGNNRTFETMHD